MKVCDAKKQSITYRAIRKTRFTEEDFEVFYLVFLQEMCANMVP